MEGCARQRFLTLTEAVGLIRQALGDDPQKPEFVQTVHRRGYRFVAVISTEPAADTAAGRSALPVRAGRSHQRGCAFDRDEAGHDTARRHRGNHRNNRAAGVGRILGVEQSRSVSCGASGPRQRHVPGIGGADSPFAHPIVTVSPDGQRFVYVGGEPEKARLYLREMNRFDAEPLEGIPSAIRSRLATSGSGTA